MLKILQNIDFSTLIKKKYIGIAFIILFCLNMIEQKYLFSQQPETQNHFAKSNQKLNLKIQLPEKLSLELVQTLPHYADSYCQGLYYEFDQKLQRPVFYESSGRYGKSKLKKIDIQNGQTLQEIDLPERFFGEGLAVVDNLIYLLTWQERTCLVLDKETFKQIDDFRYPNEGWGLTFDGKNLVMSDGTSQIRFVNPKTFKIEKKLDVFYYNTEGKKRSIDNINELEFIEGEIWANIFQTPYIIRINPQTGQVIEVLNFKVIIPKGYENHSDFVLNGIAYNQSNNHIFLTGKCWPILYELKITNFTTSTQ
ncbi:MAG: glutaminyl-peptide cyclotransferase [Planctomycetia bacterium]|nr:glutaminyl-peptide cyclotransferase [Planctomycetia bacterium]